MDDDVSERHNTMEDDRISELPDPILPNILYYLPLQDAARVCVLSKRWREIQIQSSSLVFKQPLFKRSRREKGAETRRRKRCRDEATREWFIDYIEKRLECFFRQNSVPLTFDLTICGYDEKFHSPLIDSWLKRVMVEGIKKLYLRLLKINQECYLLPQSVINSKTITHLRLYRCKVDHSAEINLPQLQNLNIKHQDFNDGLFCSFISGCPKLELLHICSCSNLTDVEIKTLPLLSEARFINCPNLANIEIQSENLVSFGYGNRQLSSCNIKLLPSTVTFSQLLFQRLHITSALLDEVISRCEWLILFGIGVQDIKISSPKLRALHIINCGDLRVETDCPNLNSLSYCGNRQPLRSIDNSRLYMVFFDFMIDDILYNDWLQDFFAKLNVKKESIKIVIKGKDHEDVVALDGLIEFMIPILRDIKEWMRNPRVYILSPTNTRNLDHLANSLLECRGVSCKNLHVISTYGSNNHLAQVLYDKLSKTQEVAKYCCEDRITQCWRHYLCNVKKYSYSNRIPTVWKPYHSEAYQIARIMFEWKNDED